MDYLFIALMTGMGVIAVVGAYSAGFCRGYDQAEKDQQWSRWFIRRNTNRSERI